MPKNIPGVRAGFGIGSSLDRTASSGARWERVDSPWIDSSMSLFQLIYVSTSSVELSPLDLKALGRQSARRNHACAVTGLLTYGAGSFLQLLEGRAATVEAIFARIVADPRHSGIDVLLRSHDAQHLFPNWSMGLLDLDAEGTALDRARLTAMHRDADDHSDAGARALTLLRELGRQLVTSRDQRGSITLVR